MTAAARSLEGDGFTVLEALLAANDVAALAGSLDFATEADKPGRRVPTLDHPTLARLIGSEGALGRTADDMAGETCKPVRILLFDKTPDSNWAVPWHQDRTISVAARCDVDGFGPWSTKDGGTHVEPPVELLARMLVLRLHLDDCPADNGALMALSGSYRLGRVPAGEVAAFVANGAVATLAARAGDVVVMRGLTIHASRRARAPGRRRVIHVEYVPQTAALPPPLDWALA